jgi:hypothetical protein
MGPHSAPLERTSRLAREAGSSRMKDLVDEVKSLLFAGDGAGRPFAVLDGASVPDLRLKLWEQKVEHECLFRGELKPDVAEVAPYLAQLEPDQEFTGFLIERGWGQHWGIFALSQASLPELRRHFRTFFLVHDTEGKGMYFRYYDPRVMRTFLPTCNAQELRTMFGPVTSYIVEGEQSGEALRFRFAGDSLRKEIVPVKVLEPRR